MLSCSNQQGNTFKRWWAATDCVRWYLLHLAVSSTIFLPRASRWKLHESCLVVGVGMGIIFRIFIHKWYRYLPSISVDFSSSFTITMTSKLSSPAALKALHRYRPLWLLSTRFKTKVWFLTSFPLRDQVICGWGSPLASQFKSRSAPVLK